MSPRQLRADAEEAQNERTYDLWRSWSVEHALKEIESHLTPPGPVKVALLLSAGAALGALGLLFAIPHLLRRQWIVTRG